MADKHRKTVSLTIDTKSASSVSGPTKHPELGESRKSESNVNNASNRRRSSTAAANTRRSSAATATSTTATSTTRHSDSSRRSSKTSRLDLSNATTRSSDRPPTKHRSESKPSPHSSADLDELLILTFVVIGAEGIGKSTFIRNAFDLQRWPNSSIVSSKVSLSGNIYRVQLVALPFEHVDFTTRPTVSWPKYLDGSPFPRVDGALCLYDFADEDTFSNLPQVLGTLTASAVPATLVACNSDTSEDQQQDQARFHDRIRRSFATVTIADPTSDRVEKRTILSMLKTVLGSPTFQPGAKPVSGTSQRPKARPRSRESSPGAKSGSRSRSHSHLSSSKSKEGLFNPGSRPPVIESADERSDAEASDSSLVEIAAPRKTVQENQRRAEPQTPVSSTEDLIADQQLSNSKSSNHGGGVPETPESYYVKSMLRPSSPNHDDNRDFQTFLNMAEDEELLHDANSASVDDASKKLAAALDLKDSSTKAAAATTSTTTTTTTTTTSTASSSKGETGVPFQELVERLLGLPASKQASKFVPAFLCLYRLFATPKQLLATILEQFMTVEKSNEARFTKVAEMLRYLQVLGQWTAQYPGDFADPTTRAIATTFVQSLVHNREFGPAANQINNNLGSVVPDEDADWSYTDSSSAASNRTASDSRKARGWSSTSSSTSTPSSTYSIQPSRPRKLPGVHAEEEEEDDDDDATPLENMILNSAKSSQSFLNLAQLSRAREESKALRARPHVRLSKVQWHQFMDTPTEELAREITRIDWTLYSSIRPRDYVRHVSLSSSQKRESRRQDNISQMVRHFNHLAIFVSGMVLLRDKPKHRAQALEKFMDLAWKVRQLNNYNSLGAIVAGINGHEISRLAATRELVPAEKLKQFMRLTILMSVSRSHAAYRMAWENSSAERIPFLPLLRQDLTLASHANPTFIGTNINWKKFEIMGEAVVSVQRSLEQPYSFPRRSTASDLTLKLILETQIIDEPEDSVDPGGELYSRSIQVEPPAAGPGADGRKKFDWLRR